MRNFIVSDLHGNGNMYDIIMNYIANLNSDINDEITLYINGDLIDRGPDSARMLIDIKNRITYGNNFNIEYLAGNHELMMYQSLKSNNNFILSPFNNWIHMNGGDVTLYNLMEMVDANELRRIVNFISSLKTYHLFNETINNKKIILVHAKCPAMAFEHPFSLKDDFIETDDILWAREDDFPLIKRHLGNSKYFTIIGHTPVKDKIGFIYNKEDNYLNIDGGCSGYVLGIDEYDHTPLVEIDNNRLNILTFNNNNEIIYGNYLENGSIKPMDDETIEKKKIYLK